MFYKCKRCGFICDQKNGLRRHLNRKNQCEPYLEDIGIETLKLELGTKVLNCKPYVNYTVNTLSTKNKDFTIKNNTNLNTKGKYICNYCKLEFFKTYLPFITPSKTDSI